MWPMRGWARTLTRPLRSVPRSGGLDAFESPNFPPLALLETGIRFKGAPYARACVMCVQTCGPRSRLFVCTDAPSTRRADSQLAVARQAR